MKYQQKILPTSGSSLFPYQLVKSLGLFPYKVPCDQQVVLAFFQLPAEHLLEANDINSFSLLSFMALCSTVCLWRTLAIEIYPYFLFVFCRIANSVCIVVNVYFPTVVELKHLSKETEFQIDVVAISTQHYLEIFFLIVNVCICSEKPQHCLYISI